ncbi:MAG: hypothetical protein HY006_03185 [Candidatus Sungbacteria bacterium]|nr:hypothetical protein [Candidatus Sungbacteria bacterium]
MDPKKWNEFVAAAFEAAGLPEVDERNLEPGTYTNQQIVAKVRHPSELLRLLTGLPQDSSVAAKRSILSFALDLLGREKT